LKRINQIPHKQMINSGTLTNKEFPGERLQNLIQRFSEKMDSLMSRTPNAKGIEYSEKRFRENISLGQEHAAIHHLKNVIRLRTKKIILDHCEG